MIAKLVSIDKDRGPLTKDLRHVIEREEGIHKNKYEVEGSKQTIIRATELGSESHC
jgi:hypothetical protein